MGHTIPHQNNFWKKEQGWGKWEGLEGEGNHGGQAAFFSSFPGADLVWRPEALRLLNLDGLQCWLRDGQTCNMLRESYMGTEGSGVKTRRTCRESLLSFSPEGMERSGVLATGEKKLIGLNFKGY